MNYLSVEKISKSFGEREILHEGSFGLDQGDKVALVGVNGGGKSTLLKMIAGKDNPDSGQIRLKKDISLTFLDQNPELDDNLNILDTVLAGDSAILRTVREYHHKLESGSSDLEGIIAEMDAVNAWDFESTITQMLGKLGLENPELRVGELSGGMKKRIALAKALIEDPEFLILDEPTNHLDLEAIEWLENYLTNKKTTLLLVSHDRYFLDKVCNAILEIEDGSLYKHSGNYVSYLTGKEERRLIKQKDADKARNLLTKELDWLRRQPKARGSKAKYRVEGVARLQEKASSAPGSANLELDINTKRQGKKILELKSVFKSFPGKPILTDFSYTFKKGERAGIIGKNGSGKSTFLNVLTQSAGIDSGEISQGKNTLFGYYRQEEFPFSDDIKVIDAVRDEAEIIKTSEKTLTASQLLNKFMFPPKKQHDYIGKLSGGEKKRLQLLRVLMRNPNFLILDEPTNDLDIITLNVLEEYLLNFEGCLLLVSHDRYFMDKLVEHLLVFKGDGIIEDFPGNYTDYRSSITKVDPIPEKTEAKSTRAEKPRHNDNRKLSFKEKQEFESLEGIIEELTTKKEEVTLLLNSGETDHIKLREWGNMLEEINKEINTKEMRWLELSEIEG